MYKDKDKQREANRKASRRARIKRRATTDLTPLAQGVTNEGVTPQGMTQYPRVSDQDFTKLMAKAGPGHVRVSKPGDVDYVPQCETTRAFVAGAV